MLRAWWLALLLAPGPAVAADRAVELLGRREVSAIRVPSGAVRIDGHLDEPAWAAAPVGSRFVQSSPDPGAEATLRTEFRVLVDDQALYVGVRLADPEPSRILRALGRRDDENVADWCFVEIDSRHDRRSGFSLGVNAGGLQADGAWTADSSYDAAWNAVYDTAVSVDAGGWTAEFRIPFSQLPFLIPAGASELIFGFNVYRSNPRTGEGSNWSPRLPELSAVVSRFNLLHLPAPPSARRLELSPYVRADLGRDAHGARRSWQSSGRAGLDLRAGLGTGLTLTATVLPDFGQVEADPTQLNLSGYELFLTERRPFFTEGADAFRFDTSLPLVSRDDSFIDETPFYSRRIGRAPRGSLPDGALALSRPVVGDLLGAAKLSGRTAGGWRLGILAAWTGAAEAELAPDARAWPLEPPALSFVSRIARERADGEAEVGLIVTGLHRPQLEAPLDAWKVRDAWVGGVDGRLRFAAQTWELRGWVLGSLLVGSPASIVHAAEGPLHGFGRPDAPGLQLSPGTRHLAGVSAEGRLAKVGGAFQGMLSLRTISPGFDMNELGFQRNANWHLVAGQWWWQGFPSGSWLRKWKAGTDNAGVGWTWEGQLRAAVVNVFVETYFRNFWDLRLSLGHDFPATAPEWLHGGPALRVPARDTLRFTVHTDTRSPTGLTLDATGWTEPGSGSRLVSVNPTATLRLGNHVLLTLGATYVDQTLGWYWVGGSSEASLSWVSRLHQRSVSASVQADIAFSSRLVLQLYAQPFATSGVADGWASLASASATAPDDRFRAVEPAAVVVDETSVRFSTPGGPVGFGRPDVSQRTLQASAVLRWEFQPGSFLTGVWTHRGDVVVPGPVPLVAQLRQALVEPGVDVFLVKLNVFLSL